MATKIRILPPELELQKQASLEIGRGWRSWRETLCSIEAPQEERAAWAERLSDPLVSSRLEIALQRESGPVRAALAALSPEREQAREYLGLPIQEALERAGLESPIPSRLHSPAACLVRALCSTGAYGERLAAAWLSGEREEQYSGWSATTPGRALTARAWKYLSYALYKDKICRPVALPLLPLERLAGAAGGSRLVGLEGGSQAQVLSGDGERLALLNSLPFSAPGMPFAVARMSALSTIMQEASRYQVLRSLLAARFVSWFSGVVQDRTDQGAVIVIQGGWRGLAACLTGRALHAPADEQALKELIDPIRELILCLCRLILPIPGVSGAAGQVLFLSSYQEAQGRQASVLALQPGLVWRSDIKPKGYSPFLAPLLLPPLQIGRRNERGALAWMFFLIGCELRKQAPDLFGGIGAYIPVDTFACLLERAGGPVSRAARLRLVGSALESWQALECLEQTGADRWHMGRKYPEIRRFLEEGGKRTIEGKASRSSR